MWFVINSHIDSIVTSSITALLVFFITSRVDNKLREKNSKYEFIRNREYDTHEKVYEEINNLKNDQESSWVFNSQKKKNIDSVVILGYGEFCKLIENEFCHNLNIDGIQSYIISEIKIKLIPSIKRLSRRSKNKIQEISGEIMYKYEKTDSMIELETDNLADSFGYYTGHKLSFNEDNYIKYCRTQREINLLDELVPLLDKLRSELVNYIHLK